MHFTHEEREFLIKNGWQITHNGRVAEKNWNRIRKYAGDDFERQTCIMDPDSNDFWEFDREEAVLARAILHSSEL